MCDVSASRYDYFTEPGPSTSPQAIPWGGCCSCVLSSVVFSSVIACCGFVSVVICIVMFVGGIWAIGYCHVPGSTGFIT